MDVDEDDAEKRSLAQQLHAEVVKLQTVFRNPHIESDEKLRCARLTVDQMHAGSSTTRSAICASA